jgi:hypothetical protein
MEQLKQLALTWFRAAAAAVVALYIAGETNPKTLGAAALAGMAGPVLKWLDPSATEFGRGSSSPNTPSKALLRQETPLP